MRVHSFTKRTCVTSPRTNIWDAAIRLGQFTGYGVNCCPRDCPGLMRRDSAEHCGHVEGDVARMILSFPEEDVTDAGYESLQSQEETRGLVRVDCIGVEKRSKPSKHHVRLLIWYRLCMTVCMGCV